MVGQVSVHEDDKVACGILQPMHIRTAQSQLPRSRLEQLHHRHDGKLTEIYVLTYIQYKLSSINGSRMQDQHIAWDEGLASLSSPYSRWSWRTMSCVPSGLASSITITSHSTLLHTHTQSSE